MIRGIFGRRSKQRLRIIESNSTTTETVSQELPPDETPNSFAFTDVTNAPLSTLETSNTITVSGMDDGVFVAASITGSGELQRNSDAWQSTPVSVQNGDTVTVRHTSSSSNSTAVSTTLDIGGVTDTFTSTTQDAVTTAGQPFGLLLAFTKAA